MDVKFQKSPDGEPFVWIIALGEGDGSEALALSDEATGRMFVPAFVTKEDGLVGMGRLTASGIPGGELQAIPLMALESETKESGAVVLILNSKGEPLGEYVPDSQGRPRVVDAVDW